MKYAEDIPLIRTIKERCRVCYTCVRECPAKAIRIADGQAEVLPERCIGCGNCVRVCSQGAKEVLDTTQQVRAMLDAPGRVAACIAPSFPAEFTDVSWGKLVGMLRAMGFDVVAEVGYGADLVAAEYRKLLARNNGEHYVATSCPAIVAYVERYHPEMVRHLAPIVSPMLAEARVLHKLHGDDLKVVFIGPCIAKKGEAASLNVADEIDVAITFIELRQMFRAAGIAPATVKESDFDPPHAGQGALFSISRGLLQAADIEEDLVSGDIVATEGRTNFVQAIREFQSGDLDARLLEVLCCQGCIMGAGMSCDTPLFSRRGRVSRYVRERLRDTTPLDAKTAARLEGMDLTRRFTASDQRMPVPFEDEIQCIMARMGKTTAADELNCGACGYDTCREHAVAIFKGLAETEMCLPYTIDQLRNAFGELAESHKQLATAQEALMQSEKLASMGQLAAGIAHEVNNPLGVVLMYAHLLLDERKEDPRLRMDLEMITEQADRCKKIVAGLLHFARQNKVVLQAADARELIARSLRTVNIPEHVHAVVADVLEDPTIEVDSDQIIQALTNLMSNAVAAMGDGGTLSCGLDGDENRVSFIVTDTGVGIPEEHLPKIFDPFFTTKQIGKGTGLGLAVTYGVVKMHRGDIQVTSNAHSEDGPTGTTFTITLPRRAQQD